MATIPAGTKATDIFPKGMYIARVNGITVDVYDEDFREVWVMGVNNLNASNIHGDGLEDLITLQDDYNDANSLDFNYFMRSTCPPLLYDADKIEGSTIVNEPGTNVPIRGLQLGESLASAVFQMQPAQRPPIDIYMERVARNMLEHAGANSVLAGAADVDNTTATAAQLNNQAAQALVGLKLALRSEADVYTFTIVLKLVQAHWKDARYLPLMGRHGKLEGKWFKGADIPCDYVVSSIPNSWMPRSEAERRNDIAAALASVGIPLGPWNPQCPQDLREIILETFNFPFDADSFAIDNRDAIKKLNKLKLVVEAAENAGLHQQVDQMGQNLALKFVSKEVPFNPLVDNGQVHTKVISDFLKSDEAEDASPVLLEILNMRISEIFMAQMQMQGQIQQMQMMQQMAMNPQAMQGQPGQPGQAGMADPSQSQPMAA